MGLPEAYLEVESIHCGCDVCFGAPTAESGVDKLDASFKGWCRIAVKTRRMHNCKDTGSNEKWQRAFHGTRPVVIRRILDEGHLLPSDLTIWQRPRAARSTKGHDGDSEGCQLLFSPVLNPASTSTAAPPAEFFDPLFKVRLWFSI